MRLSVNGEPMKRSSTLGLAALLLGASGAAQAQAPKISGLVQVWYTQMLDNNLRLNSAPSVGGDKYYKLRSEFKENGFNIRRTELKLSGKMLETETGSVEYEVMFDPAIGTGSSNMLQDATLTYKWAGGLELKVGQFKNQQSLEGLTSSSELLLVERGQIARTFGDSRERGATLAYTFGNPKVLGAKAIVGFFNGSGKTSDANAQKDYVARLEMNYGKAHRFGLYTLQGATDQADKGGLVAKTFGSSNITPPTAQAVLDNQDKTSNLGVYYDFRNATWIFTVEAMTGLLGRRFSTVGSAGAANREHLDQKFMGYQLTGAYTTGRHTFILRADSLNYNQGDTWYTTYNPYTQTAPGASRNADYSPSFTEFTAGWLYAFKPESLKAANIKVNYVARSRNFLAPRTGQAGEQGGDTLAVAFQVAF